MKKKLFITGLFLVNIIMMFNIWFQSEHIHIKGTILFENPIASTCILLSLLGIWINHYYGEILTTLGWLGLLLMQIYEFLTWHIRMYGGGFDLGLSLKLSEVHFFIAVILCIITYFIYKYLNNREDQEKYKYNLKTTL